MKSGDAVKTACITVLGSGFMPLASGSWGSLVAVLLFAPIWWLVALTSTPRGILEIALVVGVVVSSWLSIRWGEWAIARFKRKDPKQFVLDEFAGQWVALLVMPIALDADLWSWCWIVGGQLFWFRLFDVLKPPPARQLERLHAGWGILIDDLFAGAYANIVGQIIWRLTPAASMLNVTLEGGA